MRFVWYILQSLLVFLTRSVGLPPSLSGLNDWRAKLEGTSAALAYPTASAQGFSAAASANMAKATTSAPLLLSTAPASTASPAFAGDDLFAAALALSLVLEMVGPAALAATALGVGSAALGLLPGLLPEATTWPLAHLATPASAWLSSVVAVEAVFYAGCHAYAATLSATNIHELHPYAPAQRRRDWKRILADPATPLPQLAESWHYRTADRSRRGAAAVGAYQPAALLARHVQQRLAELTGLAAPQPPVPATSPRAVRFGELSVGDLEHWLAKSFFAAQVAESETSSDFAPLCAHTQTPHALETHVEDAAQS